MGFADFFAIAFWPVLCTVAFISWKLHTEKRNPGLNLVLGIFGSSLGLGALLAWIIFGFVSLIVVFDFYVGIILIGLLFGYSLFYEWNTASDLRKSIYGAFCVGALVFGGWFLVGDYASPPEIVQGRIQAVFRESNNRGPDSFKMQVNGRTLLCDNTPVSDVARRRQRPR